MTQSVTQTLHKCRELLVRVGQGWVCLLSRERIFNAADWLRFGPITPVKNVMYTTPASLLLTKGDI